MLAHNLHYVCPLRTWCTRNFWCCNYCDQLTALTSTTTKSSHRLFHEPQLFSTSHIIDACSHCVTSCCRQKVQVETHHEVATVNIPICDPTSCHNNIMSATTASAADTKLQQHHECNYFFCYCNYILRRQLLFMMTTTTAAMTFRLMLRSALCQVTTTWCWSQNIFLQLTLLLPWRHHTATCDSSTSQLLAPTTLWCPSDVCKKCKLKLTTKWATTTSWFDTRHCANMSVMMCDQLRHDVTLRKLFSSHCNWW
jgi:hypothetical protein